MSFKIVHRTEKNVLFASGFYQYRRAVEWIKNFNPVLWDDKTLTKEDLIIVVE